MKLKNQLIKALSESGLENTTDHELSAANAYKVIRFRDEVAKAYKEMEDKRQKLVKDAGIEDGQKFDERRMELEGKEKRTEAEQKELDEMTGKLNKFGELYNELLNDESELNIKTIPFEEYHALAKENKQTPIQIPTGEKDKDGRPKMRQATIDFFTVFRKDLKDILWVEPAEED